MPIIKSNPGAWKIAGRSLPDFRVTENLANRISGGSTTDLSNAIQSRFVPPKPQVLSSQTSVNSSTSSPIPPYDYSTARSFPQNMPNVTNGQGTGAQAPIFPGASPQQLRDNVQQDTDTYSSLIDQDFNNTISSLQGGEQALRQQASIADQQIGNDYDNTLNELGYAEQGAVTGQEGQLRTAEQTAESALRQARDLYRQTQQSNIAQLSGLGLSSSSVSEALAEKLGVETARRIFGVTGSLGEVRQNVTKEISNIKDYYSKKKVELKKVADLERSKIQQSLMAGLQQIQGSIGQAETAKAQRRYELLVSARDAMNEINQRAQEFDQSLQRWASERSNSLTKYITDPVLLNNYKANIANLNATPGISQTYLGNYGINDQGVMGYIPGPIRSVKKDEQQLGVPGQIDYTSPSAYPLTNPS